MIAYIPIPNGATVDQRTITSLLTQVDKVETIECGELRGKLDRERYSHIGRGRVAAFHRAAESGEEFFVVNNSGAMHTNDTGIQRCLDFLKSNPDWAGVSLPNKPVVGIEIGHVMQECVVYRTEAVKGIEEFIRWDAKTCECVKIRTALVRYKGQRLGYLERAVNHIKDIGPGFTIPKSL